MATQQAGLFTQGPSVGDLLQQRNRRSMDLQQSLMQQAAQGSRTPAKARAFSLLGSSLGRALGGAMGGQDTEREKLKAKEAQQAALQQEAVTVTRGSVEELEAFADKIAPFYPEDAARYSQMAVDKREKDAATEAAKVKSDKALALAAQNKLKDDLAEAAALEVAYQEKAEKRASDDRQIAAKEAEERVARDSAIDALGANPPKHLVASINKGSKEAIKTAWSLAAEKHKVGAEARRVASIYGEGYEVGTKKNKEELRKRFERAGSTSVTVVVNKDDADNQPLTKAQRTEMQKNLITSRANLIKINKVAEDFDATHFTSWGAARGVIGGMLDRSGLVDTETPVIGGLVDFSADRQVAFTQIGQLFNAYRQEITGAAAAIKELERLKKDYMNEDRGPEATRRVLANFKKTAEDGIIELENIVEFGVALPPRANVGRNWSKPSTFTQAELDTAYAAAIAAAKAAAENKDPIK